MRKIIVLTGSYYPVPSAVGECMFNIVNALNKDDNIIVISNKTTVKDKGLYKLNNQQIIQFKDKDIDIILSDKKILKFVNRIWRYIKIILSKYTIKKSLVNNYLRELNNIKVKKGDILLSSCSPIEAGIAGTIFCKKKQINHTILLFDRFASGEKIHRNKLNKNIKFKNNLKIENYVLSNAKHILYTKSWEKHIKKYFNQFEYKTTYIEHPLIINNQNFCRKRQINKKTILYAGSFIPNYVEPHYFIQLINELEDKRNIFNLKFYVNESSISLIEKLLINKTNILIHGWISKERLEKEISDADIFVNISEKNGEQISSKIFKYISTGKPIINIYYKNDDVNLVYLKKYRNILLLNANDSITKNKNMLIKFIQENSTVVPYDVIKQQFFEFTPLYISKLIYKINK